MEGSVATQVILPLILFFIMLGMGMSLVIDDFKRILEYPKAVLLGTVGQILALPVLGFATASVFNLNPEFAVGIVLLAACPGGTTSNLITQLARGDIALSISLTVVSSIITVVSIPFIVNLGLEQFMNESADIILPLSKTILTLFVITILPVSIGMMIRYKAPNFAIRQQPRVNLASGLFLCFLVIGLMIKEKKILYDAILQLGPATLCLNLLAMAMGLGLARLGKLNSKQTTSISVEIGIQNGTLAILIATTLLHSPQIALPAAIYSLAMFLTGGILIGLRSWKNSPIFEKAQVY